MLGAGFVVERDNEEEVYRLHASAERWTRLTAAHQVVTEALKQAKLRPTPASNIPAAGMMPPSNPGNIFGGAGGFPGLGGGMNDPNIQNMMQTMMSNPEAMGAALENPMFQQMMRNDPNIPPMLRQMVNDPAMMRQMAQQMRNPAVQAQMRQAMSGIGGSMMGSSGDGGRIGNNMSTSTVAGTNIAPMASNNNAASSTQQSGNDQDQTEDDMIAEAIRRSLEDN